MADEPDNLILRYLRSIDPKIDRVQEDMTEVKSRVGRLEQHAGLLTQQGAENAVRLDKVDQRLDRIDKRLNLVEAE